jgi:hypothetical protein
MTRPAEAPTAVLSTDPLTERAARVLRDVCAGYRIDPPSVEDIEAYASVVFDVTEDAIDPQDWLVDFIDERETAAGDRCQAIFGLLDRYAKLPDDVAQAVANLAEDARFASPCDPCVLVLVTHDGSAIVADLAGGSCDTFAAGTGTWRARYWATLRPRRNA